MIELRRMQIWTGNVAYARMQVLTERSRSAEKNPTLGEPILRRALQLQVDHAPISLTGSRRHAPGVAGVPAEDNLRPASPQDSTPTEQIEMSDAED